MTEVRPRIALTLSRPSPLQEASHQRYRGALEGAGADLVVLHPGDPIPDEMDGLCLSGGGDIEAGRYGDEDVACGDIDPARDALELEIARVALDRDLPVLGICRGFQVLNVVRGGKLIQDVPGHRPKEREGLVEHRGVSVRAGSRLAAATAGVLSVNSRHHQAVTEGSLGSGLLPTAVVDGLVEAFEATDRRWVVGVQWHPERTAEVSPEALGIFGAFVEEAARTTTPAR
ncbi:MAG TPA: gamma-glutamyl-gamma-aminobutyrate hydrolase family protein [Candidatus Limnocylindria bacterium]|jgi:putative glutamine amidotransferase|nr:gamma-glutamyl-gamma-aminobutyrate hydrolase family protein [Candidatus Limnocylindria bacterium]